MARTLTDAARVLGLAPVTLRLQIRNGKLTATKVGRDWIVTDREIARYAREHRKRCGVPVFGATCTLPTSHAGAHGIDLGRMRIDI